MLAQVTPYIFYLANCLKQNHGDGGNRESVVKNNTSFTFIWVGIAYGSWHTVMFIYKVTVKQGKRMYLLRILSQVSRFGDSYIDVVDI